MKNYKLLIGEKNSCGRKGLEQGEHQQETTPILIRGMYPICRSNIVQDADDVPCTCKSSYHCSINTHALPSYSKTT